MKNFNEYLNEASKEIDVDKTNLNDLMDLYWNKHKQPPFKKWVGETQFRVVVADFLTKKKIPHKFKGK